MSLVTKEKVELLRSAMVEYRAREHITQTELAERCGLAKTTIQTVENGVSIPTARTYMQIKLVVQPTE